MDNLQDPVLLNTENFDNQENKDCQTETETNEEVSLEAAPQNESMDMDNESAALLSESVLIEPQLAIIPPPNSAIEQYSQAEVELTTKCLQSKDVAIPEPQAETEDMPVFDAKETPVVNSPEEHAKTEEEIHDEPNHSPSQSQSEEEINDDFFDHLNREQVVQALEETVREKDVTQIKRNVSLLKIKYLQLNKEHKDELLQAYLAEDKPREDYKEESDELDIRFNRAFMKYKENKQHYIDQLEKIKLENLSKKQALLDELKELIESENSSLKQIYDRFGEIQAQWKEIGAIPLAEVNIMWQNYHFYVEKFFDKVRMNRELRDLDMKKNLERKLELCEKTEALILETSVTNALTLMQEYRRQWRSIGMVEEDKREEVWKRFNAALDAVNQNCNEYFTQRKHELEENHKAKLELCQKAEQLLQTQPLSLDQLYALSGRVAALVKLWKTIGPAPKEVHREAWDRFNLAITHFYHEKKTWQSQLKEQEIHNYNVKLNLCIQAEAFIQRKDWRKAFNELQVLQEEWRKAGYVAYKQNELLKKRFHEACNAFMDNRKALRKQEIQDETQNIAKREQLIQAAKDFVPSGQINQDFDALKEIQRQWSEVGFISDKIRKKLWNQFSEVINSRFTDLKQSSQSMNVDNYKQYLSRIEEGAANKDLFLNKEKRILRDKINKLTEDVNLWENNLGFFSKSKNSSMLTEQFEKKLKQAKEELERLKSKLSVVEKTLATNNKQ
jgi:hypothetical protein